MKGYYLFICVSRVIRSLKGLMEVIAGSAITGAAVHVLHLTSIGHRHAWGLLRTIREARINSKLDITTDLYPYERSMTSIHSVFFGEDMRQDSLKFQEMSFIHVETGEVINKDNFDEYRKRGGWVIFGNIPGSVIDKVLVDPLVMIAGDVILINGKGHPRNAGVVWEGITCVCSGAANDKFDRSDWEDVIITCSSS